MAAPDEEMGADHKGMVRGAGGREGRPTAVVAVACVSPSFHRRYTPFPPRRYIRIFDRPRASIDGWPPAGRVYRPRGLVRPRPVGRRRGRPLTDGGRAGERAPPAGAAAEREAVRCLS